MCQLAQVAPASIFWFYIRKSPNVWLASNTKCLYFHSMSTTTFAATRTGTGTKEWSDFSYNICTGCQHGCLYCYAHNNRARFGKSLRTNDQWRQQHLSDKGQQLGSKVGKKGVVMFPTSHDITPEFLDQSLATIKNLLLNNSVLVVSKPHLCVIETLCRELTPNRDKVMFRFSIGSLNEQQTDFWEPGAPKPSERITALQYAYNAGYATSVSAEPMLDDNLGMRKLVNTVDPYVTDTIWLGKMQRVNRVQNHGFTGFDMRLAFIKEWQSDENILHLVKLLATHPKVKWKDSISKVIKKNVPA